MKILKIILLLLWLLATTLFVVGALTPLEFRSTVLAYITFFIAFNGMFSLRYLLTSFIKLKADRLLIAFLISVILAVTYTFLPGVEEHWKTQEIMYRQKDNPDNVIAFQMENKGGGVSDHRTVKMTRITPFFNWTVELLKVEVGSDWVKTSEYVNEMKVDTSSVKDLPRTKEL